MGRATLLLAAIIATGACSNDEAGLRPGTYEVSFTIPFSSDIPGGLIGTHEFSFRVDDPITEKSSFHLLSSRRTSVDGDIVTDDYLDRDPRGVIAGTNQWRVQWYLGSAQTLAIRVTMVNEGSRFRLPFGCRGVRSELENFQGLNCDVDRTGD